MSCGALLIGLDEQGKAGHTPRSATGRTDLKRQKGGSMTRPSPYLLMSAVPTIQSLVISVPSASAWIAGGDNPLGKHL